jgi:hypothetical protein
MRIDRSFLGWGMFFIVVGLVPLAVDNGYLSAAQVSDLWRFWPLVLVIAGLGLLSRRTPVEGLPGLLMAVLLGAMVGGALSSGIGGFTGGVCGASSDSKSFPGQNGVLSGAGAEVSLQVDCGDLSVSAQSGTGWKLEGTDRDAAGPLVESDEGSLKITSRTSDRGFLDFSDDRESWKVTLPTAPKLQFSAEINAATSTFAFGGASLGGIDLKVNAGRATVDLTGATTTGDLHIEMNAGSLALILPSTSLTGSIEVNAGAVTLCAPKGVALRLRTGDSIVSSYDFDGHGLIHDGSTWTSPGFEGAAVKIDLSAEANAGSVKLDPKEGCRG